MLENLRPLFPYLKRYWKGYVVGALALLLTNIIWGQFARIIGRATDEMQKSGVHRDKLAQWALLLIAVVLAKAVFFFLTRWVLIGLSRDIEFDLRNDFFRHLEQLSYSYYQRTRTGDIMARATNDLNAVRMLLGPGIMYTANTMVFTVVALHYMLKISPRLTAYAFIPLPVVSIIVQYFGRRIRDRFERIQAQFSEISARAQENFSGVRVIRAYAQEEAEIENFERSNKEYIKRSLKLVRMMGMLWPTLEMLLGFAIVLVLWLGGRQVIQHQMTVGDFVAFNTYMVQLTWPVIALGWVINIFQRGTASLERINEIFQERPEITNADANPELASEPVRGDIEFRNLTFSYNGTPVLRNISLRIPAGTSLAVVGPTGSGKSTLVNLIPRIYEAPPGTVLLDGRPLREWPLEQVRRNIGFVPQETFLFGDTIRENIALGTEDGDLGASSHAGSISPDALVGGKTPHDGHERVRQVAEAANIAAEIETFPEKYDTMVGERGITLSGGQKQRTAIARALIRDPRILILDDALASVDTHTEDRILNHLREVMQRRTTIFISHRVSTVRNADRIAVLHSGRIVEYGTHDELLARDGYYTDLYNKQLLEEELARV